MRAVSLFLLCSLCALFTLVTSVSCEPPSTIKTAKQFFDAEYIPVNYPRPEVKAFLELVITIHLSPGFEATTIEHFQNGELEQLRLQLQCCVCFGCLNAASLTTTRCGHATHSRCYNACPKSECPTCKSTARLAPEQETAVKKLLRLLETIESIPPADPDHIRTVVEKFTEKELREMSETREAGRGEMSEGELRARAELRLAEESREFEAALTLIKEAHARDQQQKSLVKAFMEARLLAHLGLLRRALKTVVADLRKKLTASTIGHVNLSILRPRNRNQFLSDPAYRERTLYRLYVQAKQIVPLMSQLVPHPRLEAPNPAHRHAGDSLDWLDHYADEMYRCNLEALSKAFANTACYDYSEHGVVPMGKIFETYRDFAVRDRQVYSDLRRHGDFLIRAHDTHRNRGSAAFNRIYRNDETSELEIELDVYLLPWQRI